MSNYTESGTVHTIVFQADGEFQVKFRTRRGDFGVGGLDALMHAVQWARRRLLELDETPPRWHSDAG